MALPVWAHARGHLYPKVVMEDGDEDDLMGHEATSSPEPYFCRPMLPTEVVDAITCASGFFRSAKGLFAATGAMSFYPPRGDLLDLLGQPCPPLVNRPGGSCDAGDSARFAVADDLDTVATATPAPGSPYTGSWVVPAGLAPSGYALMVEVGKEFDTNSDYVYPSAEGPLDRMFSFTYGLRGNIGQPSVVYRVPVKLAVNESAIAVASAGHGDPVGEVGTLFPTDGTLSIEAGTGEGRLATSAGPDGSGIVHVEVDSCSAVTCETAPPLDVVAADIVASDVTPTSAVVEIRQEAANVGRVLGYEVRFRELPSYERADASDLSKWIPGPTIPPGPPGSLSTATLTALAPGAGYVVAVRARDACGATPPTLVRFVTPTVKFQKLSGCFIVTAAFDVETVAALRRERDSAVRASVLASVAADLYYRSSPPLADLIRRSETARAVTRGWLGGPIMAARIAGEALAESHVPTTDIH